MSRPRWSVVAAVLAATLTTSALSASAATPTTPAAPSYDAKQGAKQAAPAESAAKSALSAVQALRTAGPVTGGRDATLALRDLALHRSELTGADREAAEALLKRPPDAGGGDGFVAYDRNEATPLCDADLCIHYVATGSDAPTPVDADLNGYPDYVDDTLAVMAHVHDTYITAGYREPLPDKAKGGNAKIDIYLADIGPRGLYGYCTTDEPNTQKNRNNYDRWAYCVLDNDYAANEFPSHTSLQNLQVTAAHEYFHATQYAYDAFEDSWLLEATATWAEDELYDSVDDNVQYLPASQLARPGVSLDTFKSAGANSGFQYGTWSFFRFLTEKYRTKKGGLPRLVLDVFKKADGAKGGPDKYSWQAVDAVLKAKKTTGAAQLAAYAVANRRPGASYSEGKANDYPTAPLAKRFTVKQNGSTKVSSSTLDHLTSATYRFTPQGVAGGRKLAVKVDLAPTVRGSLAVVTVVLKSGQAKTTRIHLDKQGNGVLAVPFASATVSYAEATLVNASGRFTNCFKKRTPYSCSGTSKDDNLVAKVSASVR